MHKLKYVAANGPVTVDKAFALISAVAKQPNDGSLLRSRSDLDNVTMQLTRRTLQTKLLVTLLATRTLSQLVQGMSIRSCCISLLPTLCQ